MASALIADRIIKAPRLGGGHTVPSPRVRGPPTHRGMPSELYDGSRPVKITVKNTNPNITTPIVGQFVIAMGDSSKVRASKVHPEMKLMTLPEVNYFLQNEEKPNSGCIDANEVLSMYNIYMCGFVNAISDTEVTIVTGGLCDIRIPLSLDEKIEENVLVVKRIARADLPEYYQFQITGTPIPKTNNPLLHSHPVQIVLHSKKAYFAEDATLEGRMFTTIKIPTSNTKPNYVRSEERRDLVEADFQAGLLVYSAASVWSLFKRKIVPKDNFAIGKKRSFQDSVRDATYKSGLIPVEVRIRCLTDC